MRLVKIGAITLPDADAEDDMSVGARSNLVELKDGAFDMDGSTVNLKPGRISRRTMMVGEDIDGQADSLYKEMKKGRTVLRAKLRDNVRERVTYGKITNISRPVNVDDYECKQPLVLNWSQDFPFWLDADHLWFLDTGEFLDSGLNLDGHYSHQVVTSTPHTAGIVYGGSARGTYGSIVIRPQGGASISNPTVTHLESGLAFTWEGTVGENERLDVDWLTRTVRYQGSDAFEQLTIADPKQVEFMALEVGDNNLRLSGVMTGATIDWYIQYADMFV